MNDRQRSRFAARAKILKALAHPTRLFIVDELARGERRVADLTGMVGADMSTVSRHLALLKQAGILSDERRGASIFYRLEVPCVLNFLSCAESVIESNTRRQLEISA